MGMDQLTEAERAEVQARKDQALRDLERSILAGRVTVAGDAEKPAFDGWAEEERSGWCDACAYRALMAEGSSALRMAQARQQPDRMARRAAQ